MLKKFVQVFVWMILICHIVTGLAQAQSMHEPELLPEVRSLINELPLFTENELRQNAAAGLMGITAPAGADYMRIGASIMIDNRQALIEGLKVQSLDEESFPVFTIENYLNGREELNLDMRVNGQSYKFACSTLENNDCIVQTLEDRLIINMLISRNSELMQRYLEVIGLPQYDSYTYRVAEPFPSFQVVMNLGDLHLAQAILALNDGRSDDAYEILRNELNFTKLMLQGDGSLIDKMIAIQRLNRFYQTLESIINHSQWLMSFSKEQWSELIVPLNEQEQKGLSQGFARERNWSVFLFYTLENDDHDSKNLLERLAFDMVYSRIVTVNTAYLSWQPVIEVAMLNQSQVAALFIQGMLPDLQEEQMQIVQHQNEMYARQYGEFFNVVGKTLLDFSFGDISTRYFYRFYNAQIYMALVSLKYEILNAGVSVQEVSAFLETLGDKAVNPLTQEPFIWDETTQELRTVRFIETNNERGATRTEAVVRIMLSE